MLHLAALRNAGTTHRKTYVDAASTIRVGCFLARNVPMLPGTVMRALSSRGCRSKGVALWWPLRVWWPEIHFRHRPYEHVHRGTMRARTQCRRSKLLVHGVPRQRSQRVQADHPRGRALPRGGSCGRVVVRARPLIRIKEWLGLRVLSPRAVQRPDRRQQACHRGGSPGGGEGEGQR